MQNDGSRFFLAKDLVASEMPTTFDRRVDACEQSVGFSDCIFHGAPFIKFTGSSSADSNCDPALRVTR